MSPKYTSESGLRLPVPYFDLFLVLIVSFLVFVAPVKPEGTPVSTLDLPVAQGTKTQSGKDEDLVPVYPRRGANNGPWLFKLAADGKKLGADALARHANGRKVVIVLPAATPVQDLIAIQTTLSLNKVSFGLAVKNEQEPKP
jgi:biopolymer transport protein ExbD